MMMRGGANICSSLRALSRKALDIQGTTWCQQQSVTRFQGRGWQRGRQAWHRRKSFFLLGHRTPSRARVIMSHEKGQCPSMGQGDAQPRENLGPWHSISVEEYDTHTWLSDTCSWVFYGNCASLHQVCDDDSDEDVKLTYIALWSVVSHSAQKCSVAGVQSG